MRQSSPGTLRAHLVAAGAFAVAVLVAAVLAFPVAPAYSDEPDLGGLQAQIEASAAAFDQATERVAQLEQQMVDNQQLIDEISQQLPAQRQQASDSMRVLYKLQQGSFSFIELLLTSDNLGDFLQRFDYLDYLHQHNAAQIEKLGSMKTDLEIAKYQLEADSDEAQQQVAAAQQSLEQAQQARQRAQAEAIEKARVQLAAQNQDSQPSARTAQVAVSDQPLRAVTAAGAAAPSAVVPAAPASAGVDSANAASPVANEQPEVQAQGTVEAADVSWADDKTAFVDQWAARIDAYLGGSPLAGQGRTFAEAAWNYGVDPRWSPAIAYAESSLGAVCFLPHNAWGWGSSSWGSWEAAINDHVAGLARGYGSTITYEAALKYCPPNANHWYNVVLAQMNSI